MKLSLIFLNFVFVLCLFSCKENDVKPYYVGEVSMSINGVPFVPKTYADGTLSENVDYITITAGNNNVMTRMVNGKKQTLNRFFTIYGNASKINTVYEPTLLIDFKKDAYIIADYSESWDDEKGNTAESETFRAVGGKIIFSRLDHTKVEGTFEFDAQSLKTDSKIVSVTGGKFSFVPQKR